MVIFLSGVFIPEWAVYLWLFGLITCPTFAGAGIYYLLRKKYGRATFVLSLIAQFLIFLFFHLINFFPRGGPDYVLFLSITFGFVAAISLLFTGLPAVPFAAGIVLNFLAIFGLVGLVENTRRQLRGNSK